MNIITVETNKKVALENANSDSHVRNSKSMNYGEKVSKISLSDGSKNEELYENRYESTECINATSVIGLDIGCITDEVPTPAEIEKYTTIGHIPLPKQFPNDLDKQTFPEIALKFHGTKGEVHKREFLVWSQVKQALYCLPCQLFWHAASVSSKLSARSALASPGGWSASAKW